MKQIDIIVKADGSGFTADAKGFSDGSCEDVLKELLKMGTLDRIEKKAEFGKRSALAERMPLKNG